MRSYVLKFFNTTNKRFFDFFFFEQEPMSHGKIKKGQYAEGK